MLIESICYSAEGKNPDFCSVLHISVKMYRSCSVLNLFVKRQSICYQTNNAVLMVNKTRTINHVKFLLDSVGAKAPRCYEYITLFTLIVNMLNGFWVCLDLFLQFSLLEPK